MSDRKQHIHYQCIRAFADGWKIEASKQGLELYGSVAVPSFINDLDYRIIPDEDGWLPWYGGKEPPIDGPVDVKLADGTSNERGHLGTGYVWDHSASSDSSDIIAYRPHKEIKKETQKVKYEEWRWRNPSGQLSDSHFGDKETLMAWAGDSKGHPVMISWEEIE
jgi:hypothetical protein